jgi:hypothetical protein
MGGDARFNIEDVFGGVPGGRGRGRCSAPAFAAKMSK